MLFVKCAASAVLLFGYFLCYLVVLATGLHVGDLATSAADKAVSLFTFFALVCGLLAVVKWALRPSVAVVVGIALYWGITLATAMVWWRLTAHSGDTWGLGVDTEYQGFVAYINVIPVFVFSNRTADPAGLPQVVGAMLNAAVALTVGGLGLAMARGVRYNFAEVAA